MEPSLTMIRQRACGAAPALRADLDAGAWQRRHGALLAREALDLGYRLLVAESA